MYNNFQQNFVSKLIGLTGLTLTVIMISVFILIGKFNNTYLHGKNYRATILNVEEGNSWEHTYENDDGKHTEIRTVHIFTVQNNKTGKISTIYQLLDNDELTKVGNTVAVHESSNGDMNIIEPDFIGIAFIALVIDMYMFLTALISIIASFFNVKAHVWWLQVIMLILISIPAITEPYSTLIENSIQLYFIN